MGTATRPPASAAGFSVIEVLIASGIFLIVAIGILPLFSEAILRSRAGSESTSVSNIGISRAEEVMELDFNDARLAVTTALDYYSRRDLKWKTGTPPSDDPALWLRASEITQYGIGDLLDNGRLDDPLPAGTDPVGVHLKQVSTKVSHAREPGNPLRGRNDYRLRVLKAF